MENNSEPINAVEEVARLLEQWEQQNTLGDDVTATLMRLADVFESEMQAFLKKDPDPFDDRHPSRLQPDCTFGHMLKTMFRNERIVDEMVKVYCQRDVLELNIATVRLLLDILPGLESVIFQEEGFVPRLFHWAEKSPNPLQSYATGLLAAAMDTPEVAASYKERNAYFVPLMLRRLHDCSHRYLLEPPKSEFSPIFERPFAGLGGEYSENNAPNGDHKHNSLKAPKKGKDQAKSVRYSPFPIEPRILYRKTQSKTSPIKSSLYMNEASNSNWTEVEKYVIGSYQVYPLTLAAEQRYILQYLTPMGEYQDVLGTIFEEKAMPLILRYIDISQNPDVRLAFEALKYLASLLCHKKIAMEFLQLGGLQRLLKVPFPSIAATGVSICLYYLAYLEEVMEKICLLPSSPLLTDLVSYALHLLECSHDSSRCHATMFFGCAFAFQVVLKKFDEQDGLRKLFNVMSTLDIFVMNGQRSLTDDQIFANRQTTRHVCGTLKCYFEAHLVLEVDRQLASAGKTTDLPKTKPYKAVNLSPETIESYMDKFREMQSSDIKLKAVDDFLNLEGLSFLLDLITSYFELSYSGRAETVKSALDVVKICSLTPATQALLCERLSSQEYTHVTGILVLLQAADGELMPGPEIQRSALHCIINCICTKIPPDKLDPSTPGCSKSSSTPKKKIGSSEEKLLKNIWENVRRKNGINILINLLNTRTPLTDADSIRALACQALCGLAQSDKLKQIISKLPLVTNGVLLELMKEPVLQDKGHEHVKFCQFGLELIEKVTGAPVCDGSDSSMLNINKREIVAKTQITYKETQLLQLISEHLVAKGFNDTATSLQREMAEKSIAPLILPWAHNPTTPSRPSTSSTSTGSPALRGFRACEAFSSPSTPLSMSSLPSIPPPTVPLKIVLNKKLLIPEAKPNSSRLQKQETASGNYVQTPAMKRQGTTISVYGNPQNSLETIVSEYLRKQHALCKTPMLSCPPFDLYLPHKCPEPKNKRNAPVNCVLRTHKKMYQSVGYGGASLDRKFIYSKFRMVRSFRDEEHGRFDFVCSSFLKYNKYNKFDRPHPGVLIGTVGTLGNSTGRLKMFKVQTGEEQLDRDGHNRGVNHIESTKYAPLFVTSDNGRIGNSSLWCSERFEMLHDFIEVQHLEFAKTSATRIVGTKHDSAVIFDTTRGSQIVDFPSGDLGNQYLFNRATFDYTDEFILSDGLLYDVRSREVVHKLDKFMANSNGVFHPNGREIISNSEIWDIRTFKLLRSVVGLDQCRLVFNDPGTVIYGVYCNSEQPDERVNCFYTFNAYDYSPIATVDVKKPVFHLSVDPYEKYVATIESQFALSTDQFLPPINGINCVCRLYEIGRTKEEGDEDGEESDSEAESEDDEDDMDDDDDDNDDGQDDVTFEIDEVEASSTSSIDDDDLDDDEEDVLFSLNTSMDD